VLLVSPGRCQATQPLLTLATVQIVSIHPRRTQCL